MSVSPTIKSCSSSNNAKNLSSCYNQEATPAKTYLKWSVNENKIYLNFLEAHFSDFHNSFTRRSKQVFKHLAQVIPNRNASQCRTHHQKCQFKYGDTFSIIQGMHKQVLRKQLKDEKFGAEYVEKQFSKLQKQFKKLKEIGTGDNYIPTVNIEKNVVKITLQSNLMEEW